MIKHKDFVVSKSIPSSFKYIIDEAEDLIVECDYFAGVYDESGAFVVEIRIQCGIDIIIMNLEENALRDVPNGVYQYELRRKGVFNEVIMSGKLIVVD